MGVCITPPFLCNYLVEVNIDPPPLGEFGIIFPEVMIFGKYRKYTVLCKSYRHLVKKHLTPFYCKLIRLYYYDGRQSLTPLLYEYEQRQYGAVYSHRKMKERQRPKILAWIERVRRFFISCSYYWYIYILLWPFLWNGFHCSWHCSPIGKRCSLTWWFNHC
jgi:hypothetical protein